VDPVLLDDDGDEHGPWCPDGMDCDDGEATVHAHADETCNGVDDDCDGLTDEGDDGLPLRQPCYDGDADTEGEGECHAGTQDCLGGVFTGPCNGQVLPADEQCNGLDDDCDGLSDLDEAGAPLVKGCYNGPAGTAAWIGGRLPSEAEWEYGARGPMESADDYTVFPWGDDQIDCEHAFYEGCPGDEVDVGTLSPAGDSPFGLADMAGNVWEWTQDCPHGSYDGAPGDGQAWEGCGADDDRVIRGGSWMNPADNCRAALRNAHDTDRRYFHVGLRPVRPLLP